MINDKDLVDLACNAAYEKHEIGDVINLGVNSYNVVGVYDENTGFNNGIDAFLVEHAGEYALLFQGSNRHNDFYNDWILNNGKIIFNKTPPQYIDGEKLFQALINQGVDVSYVCGNSLGGGIASFVAVNNNVKAIAVNPAPQVRDYNYIKGEVKTILDKNDLLYNLLKVTDKDKYLGKTFIFERGNSFFDIYLNHKGSNNDIYRSIANQYPFDLISNNISKNLINISVHEIKNLVSNYKNKIQLYGFEFDNHVRPIISAWQATFTEVKSVGDIYEKALAIIFNEINQKMPTISNYIDFKEIFNDIKFLFNNIVVELIDEVIDYIKEKLGIKKLNDKLLYESKNTLTNYDSYINSSNDSSDGILTVSENLNNADQGISIYNKVFLTQTYYKNSGFSHRLSYLKYIELITDWFTKFVSKKALKKVKKYELLVDGALGGLYNVVKYYNKIISLIDHDSMLKLEKTELVIRELKSFNCYQTLVDSLHTIMMELIYIIFPKKIGDLIDSLSHTSSILDNLINVSTNFKEYVNQFSSTSLMKINENIEKRNSAVKHYSLYLRSTY